MINELIQNQIIWHRIDHQVIYFHFLNLNEVRVMILKLVDEGMKVQLIFAKQSLILYPME